MSDTTLPTIPSRAPGAFIRWATPIAALLLLFCMLAAPARPDALTPRTLLAFPWELIATAALLVATRHADRLRLAVRLAVTAVLIAALVVKLTDFGLFMAFGRPFNFAYDLPLVAAGWELFVGTSGIAAAILAEAGLLLAFCLVAALIWWTTGAASRLPAPRRTAVAAWTAVIALAAIPIAMERAPGIVPTTRLLADHVGSALAARHDIAALTAEAAADPADAIPPADLLGRLAGRDVILAFVESYGRSSIENPVYAATTKAALADIEAELAAGGLAARSAWLSSPTFGGQSWLAHSTLLSGLRIDSQGRYGALLRSPRRTLLRLAADAGWRTVGVMPAITKPWPEAGYYGYDRILAARDLGYKGLPFNWVTMPDQYTWSAFDRLELAPAGRKPVFAEVALISSHAPWTPIPKLVPWDKVGDGLVFDDQARQGDPPAVVWKDQDRVRDQFRQSIDYALRTIGGFASLHAARPPLLIVLGDHQPAPFVSGTKTNRDVPVHIIGDRETIALLDDWKWTPGMMPAADAPDWPMENFRQKFLETFSSPVTATPAKEPSA